MATWRLVRDALLVAAALFPLAGAVNLTLRFVASGPGQWDVLLPDRTTIILLYLVGFGLLAVLWLTRRHPSRSSLDPAKTR